MTNTINTMGEIFQARCRAESWDVKTLIRECLAHPGGGVESHKGATIIEMIVEFDDASFFSTRIWRPEEGPAYYYTHAGVYPIGVSVE